MKKYHAHPRRILALKAHSAGIGDVLRSSAAWRVLADAYPEAALHLIQLTQDPGAASEALIARHHLLASYHVVDKRAKDLRGWWRVWKQVQAIAAQVRPDWVIDFEPNGLRTTLLAWMLGRTFGARTVGIAQAPLRGWFYHRAAPSFRRYAEARKLDRPLEYTERDFVALAALGLERNGTPIELRETPEAREVRERLRPRFHLSDDAPLLGVNIGCGTPDAVGKRPDLELLSALVHRLRERHGFVPVLTGAPFEVEINREFRTIHERQGSGPLIDLAGETTLLELVGVIRACALFVSSDSGPYHMAVALRVPTLAVFNNDNRQHYHAHPWVRCLELGEVDDLDRLDQAVEPLLRI